MENSVIKAIETRRSVRSFSQKAIPEELLDAVLKAGTYAPTGGGRQSPVIVAVKDAAYRDKIARLNAEVMGKDTDPYYGAPVIILVLADGKANTFVEDGSCVLENMMIAAHSLGLGSVWVHREREVFDSEKGKELLRSWNLPETLRGVGAIALGNCGLIICAIFIALAFRMLGVLVCVSFSALNFKERLFCMIAYCPKATVQAAIGALPLAAGLACGQTILTAAVLAILITAPLGAFLTDITYKKLLSLPSDMRKAQEGGTEDE